MNVPRLAGTLHSASALSLNVLLVALDTEIRTFPFGSPPRQVTVIPLERVTVRLVALAGLTNAGAAGIVMVALKGPTSLPPVPVTVKAPGTRNVPVTLIVASSPEGTVTLPLGHLTVILEPPLRGAKPLTQYSSFSGVELFWTMQVPGGASPKREATKGPTPGLRVNLRNSK